MHPDALRAGEGWTYRYNWKQPLKFDPLPPLLAAENQTLRYCARRDLLGEPVGPIQEFWEIPRALKILRKQSPNGSGPGLEKESTQRSTIA